MTTTESASIGDPRDLQVSGDEGRLTAGERFENEWLDECMPVVPGVVSEQVKPGGTEPTETGSCAGEPVPMRAKPRAVGTEVGAPGSPRPADITRAIEKEAYSGLRDSHATLKFTVDGKEPGLVAPQDKLVLKEEKTALQIAKDTLGKNANEDQLKLFASLLIKLNGLKGDADAKIASGTELKLPGQRKDGGLYYGNPPQIQWHDNSSLVYNGDGTIVSKFTNKDGFSVTAVVDLARPIRTSLTMEKDEVRVVADGSGRRTRFEKKTKDKDKDDWEKTAVAYRDERGRAVTELYKSDRREPYQINMVNRDKSVIEGKLGADGEYHGTKKDGTGKVVDTDIGFNILGNVYSRKIVVDAGTKERHVVKAFEGGVSVTYREKDDQILKREYKDGFDRKVVATYDDDSNISAVEIKPDKGPTIKLAAKKGGDMPTGDWLDADGKTKLGTVTMGPEGQLIFKHDKDKRVRIETQDGEVEEITLLKDGGRKTVRSKDKESVTIETDFAATTKEVFKYENGRTIERTDFKDKKPQTIKIVDDDKSETTLKFDDAQGIYKGVRKDKDGKEVEDVTFNGERMIFKDRKSGTFRAELHVPIAPGAYVPPEYLEGTYNHNLSVFTIKDGTTIEYMSLAPGRVDRFDTTDKEMIGKTSIGRTSMVRKDGSAYVRHRDGSGAELDKDGKTLTIYTGGFDATTTKTELSKEVLEYLKEHKDIDKRDLIEICRKFADKPDMLKKIFVELTAIDKAKNLSDEEKLDLRFNLMKHVGSPPEISQNGSPTCAVTVVQRDMCMIQPDAYIRHIFRAVSEGKVNVAGGGKAKDVDPAKMKMLDSSGRDLATRIFQNSALVALYHPRLEFQPTEDGVGRMFKLPRVKDDKPMAFNGLGMPAIAELEYRLMGVDKTVVKVNSLDDLIAAFKKNGGRPMVVAVNADQPPFSTGSTAGDDGGHVVTILGITDTKPPRILFANQWGLSSDHSEVHRSVDAQLFMANLTSTPSIRLNGRNIGVGEVLVDGDRKKSYTMVKGVMVEDKLATEALTKVRKNEFGD